VGISRAEPPFGEGTQAPRTLRREARRLDAGVGQAVGYTTLASSKTGYR